MPPPEPWATRNIGGSLGEGIIFHILWETLITFIVLPTFYPLVASLPLLWSKFRLSYLVCSTSLLSFLRFTHPSLFVPTFWATSHLPKFVIKKNLLKNVSKKGVGCDCPPPHSLWFWKQFQFRLHTVLNPQPLGYEVSALTSCTMWTCELYLDSSTL